MTVPTSTVQEITTMSAKETTTTIFTTVESTSYTDGDFPTTTASQETTAISTITREPELSTESISTTSQPIGKT